MNWREAPATAALAVATLLVSAFLILGGSLDAASLQAGFIPVRLQVDNPAFVVPWLLTPLSATLVHGGWTHLGFNLIMLGFCGYETERTLGSRGLIVLYLIGAYVAAAGQWVAGPTSPVPMIGASGAISAVIAAYSLFYGKMRAKPLGPIPASVIHVLWLAAAWIGIQLLTGLAGLNGEVRIAIGAHIGGFIAGLLLARPLLRWRYRKA